MVLFIQFVVVGIVKSLSVYVKHGYSLVYRELEELGVKRDNGREG